MPQITQKRVIEHKHTHANKMIALMWLGFPFITKLCVFSLSVGPVFFVLSRDMLCTPTPSPTRFQFVNLCNSLSFFHSAFRDLENRRAVKREITFRSVYFFLSYRSKRGHVYDAQLPRETVSPTEITRNAVQRTECYSQSAH